MNSIYLMIERFGLEQVSLLCSKVVKGEVRYYYIGVHQNVPVIIVACGQELTEGQVWEANTGNEKGFPGYCHQGQIGCYLGKLTLRRTIDPATLGEDDAQILSLNYQITYFKSKFLPLSPVHPDNRKYVVP